MIETPARDWMLPRLKRLLADAATAGIALDVAVALITDIVDSPDFNTAVPEEPEESHPDTAHQFDDTMADTAVNEGDRLANQEFNVIRRHGRTFV